MKKYSEELFQRAIQELEPLIQNLNIPKELLPTNEEHHGVTYDKRTITHENVSLFVHAALCMAGYTAYQALAIQTGLPMRKRVIQGEYSWGSGGWQRMHQIYQVHFAVREYIKKKLLKDHTFEVGMKYPQINMDRLTKKYQVTKLGTFLTKDDRDRLERDAKAKVEPYDIYTDAHGNVYSFREGYDGKTGPFSYAGFIFKTAEMAFDFAEWACSFKSHYVKELDLCTNRLGGFGTESWEHLYQAELGNLTPSNG